jgi:sporulation protein YlmC with PRC-barrel domain
MFCCANRVKGYSVHAVGKRVGEVKDLLFDDLSWIIRYLVVDTSEWIPKAEVLLLMLSIAHIDWENQRIPVNLTLDDVKKSPDVESNLPVSRLKEQEIYAYFGRSPYWGAGFSLGAQAIADIVSAQQGQFQERPQQDKVDSHLRSIKEVSGYHLISDGETLGTVSDFFVESSNWIIRYLIIDILNGPIDKQILFSPQWVSEISWNNQALNTKLQADRLISAPAYNPSANVTRQYEEKLYEHFQQQAYWL